MAQQQPQPTDQAVTHAQATNVFYKFVSGTALGPLALLNCRHGSESFQHILWALASMLAWGAYSETPEMIGYFYVVVVICAFRRIETLIGYLRGHIYRYYTGWPWLAIRLPFIKTEGQALMIGNPILCLAAGGIVTNYSPGVGSYLALGALAILVKTAIEMSVERSMLMAMRDGQALQRRRAEQMREGRW